MTRRSKIGLIGTISVFVFGFVWFLAAQVPSAWELSDFNVTFYPVARHLLNGESVYLSAYPHPFNGREEPPLGPLWIFYTLIPFGTLPLPIAEGLRVALDAIAIPFLAYLCAQWARLRQIGLGILLVVAPWLLLELHTGQFTPLVLLGTLLCYWGTRRASAPMTAVGLWLASAKYNLVILVLLATLYFAWRQKILTRTLTILAILIVLASAPNPSWFIEVFQMYVPRMTTAHPLDVVLLLPFFPWGQVTVLILSLAILVTFLWRNQPVQPTRWLWAVLTGVSLLCAFHTFPYDWLMLMLPLALLLRERRAPLFVASVYAYAFLWAALLVADWVRLPSPAMIPIVVVIAVLAIPIYSRFDGERVLRATGAA